MRKELCRLPPIRLRRRASTLSRSAHPILPLLVQHALALPFARLARRCRRSFAPNSCAVLAYVSRDRERPSVDLDAVSATEVGQKPVVVVQTFEVRDIGASVVWVAAGRTLSPLVCLADQCSEQNFQPSWGAWEQMHTARMLRRY